MSDIWRIVVNDLSEKIPEDEAHAIELFECFKQFNIKVKLICNELVVREYHPCIIKD